MLLTFTIRDVCNASPYFHQIPFFQAPTSVAVSTKASTAMPIGSLVSASNRPIPQHLTLIQQQQQQQQQQLAEQRRASFPPNPTQGGGLSVNTMFGNTVRPPAMRQQMGLYSNQ